jgi:glycosyltransferase involved in cell wall biosynthesis
MKLSVCTITYNHGKYIEKAIEGFLSQQTDFEFEIIISDDCSTDNTLQIIEQYASKYPEKFRIIRHEKNIGMIPNFKEAIDACTGEYVAICEGDDYWINSQKLQRQVDILDSNPEYSICFHKAQLLFDGVEPFDFGDINLDTKTVSTFADLVNGNFIHTPTVVYRNHLFGKYPKKLLKYKFGDWPLHLLNAERGDVYFIPEELAVYRITSTGAWSAKSRIHKIEYTLNFLKEISDDFPGKYKPAFDASIKNYFRHLIKLQFDGKHIKDGFSTWVKYIKFFLFKS